MEKIKRNRDKYWVTLTQSIKLSEKGPDPVLMLCMTGIFFDFDFYFSYILLLSNH